MVSRLPPPSTESEAELIAEAERLLGQGEPLLAYNAIDRGLQRWPGQVRLSQLQALALARSGDLERASAILTTLTQSGIDDAETLGVLARTHKDLGMRAADPAQRATHLESAFMLYRQAYAASVALGASASAYYTGINAATVAVLRGQIDEARSLAAQVKRICEQVADPTRGSVAEYWRQATLGEAALILGDSHAAAHHYADAMALAKGRYGDLSTTRRQARLLAAHLPVDDAWLADVLRIPPGAGPHRQHDRHRRAPCAALSRRTRVRRATGHARFAAVRAAARGLRVGGLRCGYSRNGNRPRTGR
jgi:hypothetical protein